MSAIDIVQLCRVPVSALAAIDLRREAEGTTAVAYQVRLDGHAQAVEVLECDGRYGVAWGAGADWTDAASVEDAVRRVIETGEVQP